MLLCRGFYRTKVFFQQHKVEVLSKSNVNIQGMNSYWVLNTNTEEQCMSNTEEQGVSVCVSDSVIESLIYQEDTKDTSLVGERVKALL